MRFSGTVGYATSTETAPGVWTDVITEKTYSGDVTRGSVRLEPPLAVPPGTSVNLALENSFSILADAEAYENIKNIRYVTWQGQRWRVTNVEVRRPRLIIAVGELWNGDTP